MSTPNSPNDGAAANVLINALNIDLIAVNQDISSAKKLLEKMASLLPIPLDQETKEKIYIINY